jgi:predicted glycosyltransferase involved in capsule biosynthesis
MPLIDGYYPAAGVFIVNKEKYIESGGENENFYGCGSENKEREKRMKVFGLAIYRAEGPMFHLWYPRGPNRFANNKIEWRNMREFLKTCTFELIGNKLKV